jgi:hypothetical protein
MRFGGNIDAIGAGSGAVTFYRPFCTVISYALVLNVRDWLWHLTLNTGEVKKCERHHFTDWHWAQFEQAGLLPGPVELPSNSNYWPYSRLRTTLDVGVPAFLRLVFDCHEVQGWLVVSKASAHLRP